MLTGPELHGQTMSNIRFQHQEQEIPAVQVPFMRVPPLHPEFPLLLSSVRVTAVVTLQRDTDPCNTASADKPASHSAQAWKHRAVEKPNPGWQGLNNRFLLCPGPHS
uniref:Uncharacterized protein n=1 Tax=Knipowitschia caucasica TaxID=637954 RepID=A0AAV2MR73_KNICA